MASDDKKTKTAAPKAEASKEASKKDKSTPAKAPAKAEASPTEAPKTDAPPKNYSRGEGQKPVSQAYKDNWNAIFAKKKKKR